MRVVVLGAGALGSFLGAQLAAKHEVTLVGRRPHVDVVRAQGLRVSGLTEFVARPHAVARAADVAAPPDLLLVTVKAYDTTRAIAEAAPLLGPETRVLTLQNGLGNVEALLERVAPSRLLAGAITVGVTFVEPGHVRHAGIGYLRLGAPEAPRAEAEPVAAALRAAGLPAEVVDDVAAELWAKVVVNVAINPLSAITGLLNGSLLEQPELRAVMERAAEEAIDVARAAGVQLPEDAALRPRQVAERTAKNKSSMLQDVERGRRTEIDALCGAIVREGRARGVDTPVNLALLGLVKGIELSTRRA